MSSRSSRDPIASGACYLVTSVNEQPPQGLDDFLMRDVVAVTVALDQQIVRFQGSTRRNGDSILVYEKDRDGFGRDVRTWQIKLENGRLEAFARSMY